jgi:flagellar biosynthesis protein FliQ
MESIQFITKVVGTILATVVAGGLVADVLSDFFRTPEVEVERFMNVDL